MKYKPTEEFPILLGFRNGQVIVDSNVRKLDEDVFSGQVKGYDGYVIYNVFIWSRGYSKTPHVFRAW